MDEIDTANPSMLPCNIPNEGGNGGDHKRLTHLSTILVATLQEMKDQVGQIEFLFCSQIFPGFQSHDLDAVEWRKREHDLMRQVEESRSLVANLEREKDDIWGEKEAAKVSVGVLEKKNADLLSELEGLKTKVEVLENETTNILRISDRERTALLTELDGSRTRIEVLEGEKAIKYEEILVEKRNRKSLVDDSLKLKEMYKQLKSQYNFLLKKTGLLTEKDRSDVVPGSFPVIPSHNTGLKDFENEDLEDDDITQPGSEPIEQKSVATDSDLMKFVREEEGISGIKRMVEEHPQYSNIRTSGTKRPKSCWRDTRANNHEKRGIDPHDDFLNTPLEDAMRCDLNSKDMEEVLNNNLDEEDEDPPAPIVNLKQPISITKPVNKGGFKYVEPVRKKADREKLKGIQCKQCKKFYDAVYSGGKDKKDNNTIQCEHHDGVSRHRYKYVPPMTPEGFWNIGFDSDT